MPADRYHQPPTRPSPHPLPNADASSSTDTTYDSSHAPPGLVKLFPLLSRIRIHVIPAKLDTELMSIYAQIEALGGTNVRIDECSFAVSAFKGKPRLEKILGKDRTEKIQVLDVQFIKDAYERCLKFGSVDPQTTASGIWSSSSIPPPSFPKRQRYHVAGTGPNIESIAEDDVLSGDYPPDRQPPAADVALEDIHKWAVLRCSPLVCPNQDIIEAIKPIYLSREFEEADQKNSNILSYKRSMSVCFTLFSSLHRVETLTGLVDRRAIQILKSVPRRLSSGTEALKLDGLGSKVAERIDEFLKTGLVQEAVDIVESDRYKALNAFSSIFTIGPGTAVTLYDRHHCRTLEDVSDFYSAKEDAEWSEGVKDEGIPIGKTWVRNDQGDGKAKRRSRDAGRRRKEGRMSQAEIVREWAMLKDEIDTKIPRDEVEEIGRCVKEHLDALLPGCRYTLTGGYRRGKPESNDVDVVFCPPNDGDDVGLLKDLYTRMADQGIITHILQLTAASHQYQVHNNFDGLDKALVLFKLPPKAGASTRIHRRVDLISAPKSKYALAVLGWSGSMMFERDLRRYAEKEFNLKFDSGSLMNRATGEELTPKTERDIFGILKLPFVKPEWRNADG